MKQKYSPEQIVKFLREAEGKLASGKTVEEVCRAIGVSDATYYNWRRTYGHLKVDQAKRLKDIERENAYIESFNSRLRDELLNTEEFGNLREAKVLVEEHRRRYNHHRPHISRTPGLKRCSVRPSH